MTDRIQMQHILCPVDFSVFSTRALRHAAALARRFEAKLTVLHVVPQTVSYGSGAEATPEPLLANPVLCQLIKQDVSAFVAEAVGTGLPVETLVREAQPWRAILSVADELAADLIVMGTHGRGGFEELLMGSVAQKVLHRASCPVITICQEEGRPWEAPGLVRNILCATDLSPVSAPTIRHALALAAEFQCRVVLLHVVDSVLDLGGPAYTHAPVAVTLLNQHEAIARRQLQEAVPADMRAWCTVEERIVSGRPAEEILRVAAQVDADMIVMGARPQGALARTVLGSTSQHVVRAATCPVLTVRVPENAGALDLVAADASAREGAPLK